MYSHDAFVGLCENQLRLCNVQPGEFIVVLSQGHERLDYADAFTEASARLRARALHVRLPDGVSTVTGEQGVWTVGKTPLLENTLAVDTLKAADLVIDLVFLLHSKELVSIQGAGTRILTCIEPVDILARLLPSAELSAQVDQAVAWLKACRQLTLTRPTGTRVVFQVGTYPVFGQYGYADKPGQWDHWSSSGMAYTYAADDGVDGEVCLVPGDIVLPFKRYVESDVSIVIEAGRIKEISGGLDSDLIRDYIQQFDDPSAYGIAHIGWGMNNAAKWSALATDQRGHGMELRGSAGNVLFSTGPNTQANGLNNTACHLDIPLRGASLELDGKLVVDEGRIVNDALPSRPAL